MSKRSLCCAGLLLAALVTQAQAAPPTMPRADDPPCCEKQQAKLERRTYPVADLVTPIENCPYSDKEQAPPSPWKVQPREGAPKSAGANKTTEDQLIQLIIDTIEPGCWAVNGGRGTLDYFPLGGLLVISQTPDVHELVAGLLETLRRSQGLSVAAEVRFVSISDEMFKRLAKAFGINAKEAEQQAAGKGSDPVCGYPTKAVDRQRQPKASTCVAFGDFRLREARQGSCPAAAKVKLLDEARSAYRQALEIDPTCAEARRGLAQVRAAVRPGSATFLDHTQLHKFMETAQGDSRTNVMQAPRVTVLNGQEAALQVCDTEKYVTGVDVRWDGDNVVYLPREEPYTTGVRLVIQPVISADRRFVKVRFEADLTSLTSKIIPMVPITAPVTVATKKGPVGNFEVKHVPFTQYIQIPKFTKLTANETAVVADGKTMVLHMGKRTQEVRTETRVPALGPLPLAADLVTTVAGWQGMKPCVTAAKLLNNYCQVCQSTCRQETEHILVMVTPKIVVEEEEEVVMPKCRPAGGSEASEPACASPKVAKLMKQYHEACAAGDVDLARKLAIELIAINPTCFGLNPAPVRYERIRGGIE